MFKMQITTNLLANKEKYPVPWMQPRSPLETNQYAAMPTFRAHRLGKKFFKAVWGKKNIGSCKLILQDSECNPIETLRQCNSWRARIVLTDIFTDLTLKKEKTTIPSNLSTPNLDSWFALSHIAVFVIFVLQHFSFLFRFSELLVVMLDSELVKNDEVERKNTNALLYVLPKEDTQFHGYQKHFYFRNNNGSF